MKLSRQILVFCGLLISGLLPAAESLTHVNPGPPNPNRLNENLLVTCRGSFVKDQVFEVAMLTLGRDTLSFFSGNATINGVSQPIVSQLTIDLRPAEGGHFVTINATSSIPMVASTGGSISTNGAPATTIMYRSLGTIVMGVVLQFDVPLTVMKSGDSFLTITLSKPK